MHPEDVMSRGPRTSRRIGLFLAMIVGAVGFLFLLYAMPVQRLGMLLILGRADLWGYFGPMAFYFDHALHGGEWPEWNPLLFCGTPFTANPQAAVYYPPHLLRGLLTVWATPAASFLSIFALELAHLLLAIMGTFLFCRAHRLSQGPSFVAALLYAGSAAVTFRMVQHWQFVAMTAWLPWLLLVLRKAACQPARAAVLRWGLVAGAVFGLSVLIGFPQLTLYLAVYSVAYVFLERSLDIRAAASPSSPASFRLRLRRLMRADVPILAVMGLVGGLLAAPMLVPAAELAGYSARAKTIASDEELLNPKALNPFTHPVDLFQALIYYPGSHGIRLVGGGCFLLALAALLHKNRRQAAVFFCLLLVALDLCLGAPFPLASLVSALAPFKIAGPERASLFAAFALAVLAAHGLETMWAPLRARTVFGVSLFAAFGVTALGALLEWVVLDPEYEVTPIVWVLPCLCFTIYLVHVLGNRLPGARLVFLFIAAMALAEQVLWGHAFLEFLVRQDSSRLDPAVLRVPAEWSRENARETGEHWLENAKMFSLTPVINGYDPLVVEAVRQFISGPDSAHRYNRRVYAEEVLRAEHSHQAVAGRRFWLADRLAGMPPIFHADDPPGGLSIMHASADAITVEASGLTEARYLVFAETAYPGWSASVDGRPAPIVPAWEVFQAVSLGPGSHTVRFAFHSPSVVLGRAIGLGSLGVVCLAVPVLLWYERRQRSRV
ncbi:MAG: YfhO family protein [Candidatus Hydrogenedentes bacterium]|nr:YfhO family protein [Candidatus Hydrogenedentota bacterium]